MDGYALKPITFRDERGEREAKAATQLLPGEDISCLSKLDSAGHGIFDADVSALRFEPIDATSTCPHVHGAIFTCGLFRTRLLFTDTPMV